MNIKKHPDYHHDVRTRTTTGNLSPHSPQTNEQRLLDMCESLKSAGQRLKTLDQRLKTAAQNLQEAAVNLHNVTQDLQIAEQAEDDEQDLIGRSAG